MAGTPLDFTSKRTLWLVTNTCQAAIMLLFQHMCHDAQESNSYSGLMSIKGRRRVTGVRQHCLACSDTAFLELYQESLCHFDHEDLILMLGNSWFFSHLNSPQSWKQQLIKQNWAMCLLLSVDEAVLYQLIQIFNAESLVAHKMEGPDKSRHKRNFKMHRIQFSMSLLNCCGRSIWSIPALLFANREKIKPRRTITVAYVDKWEQMESIFLTLFAQRILLVCIQICSVSVSLNGKCFQILSCSWKTHVLDAGIEKLQGEYCISQTRCTP